MKIKIYLFLIVGFSTLLISCSSGESLVMNSCAEEGLPPMLCECTYDKLSESYSDSDIKRYFKDIQKADMTGTAPTDEDFRTFLMNMTNSVDVCMSSF